MPMCVFIPAYFSIYVFTYIVMTIGSPGVPCMGLCNAINSKFHHKITHLETYLQLVSARMHVTRVSKVIILRKDLVNFCQKKKLFKGIVI